jgi:catechol 2,3-dioxygenase-like lactoylglutathione lyase family enzyme
MTPSIKTAKSIAIAASLLLASAAATADDPPVTTQVVDLANKLNGSHPGFRAFHAKGVVVDGSFKASPEATQLSQAQLFNGRTIVDVIPVSDVERSKQFYELLGWRLDADDAPAKDLRIVQFTPPGSGCSVTFGKGITAAAPGSAVGALIVSDIKAAHDELIRRGIDASAMWHGSSFPLEARLPGPDPKRTSYGSFFAFNDPDGNAWLVQEVTTRLPGRI